MSGAPGEAVTLAQWARPGRVFPAVCEGLGGHVGRDLREVAASHTGQSSADTERGPGPPDVVVRAPGHQVTGPGARASRFFNLAQGGRKYRGNADFLISGPPVTPGRLQPRALPTIRGS